MTDTPDAPLLSVVLPAHNELTLLGSTVTNITTGLDERGVSYEIVIVENGSSDGTLRLARLLAVQIEAVRVVTLPVGDYGEALAAGFAATRGSCVVNFDVDYYDLSFLDAALDALCSGRAAIVLASKRAPGSSDRRPIARRLLTFGFATLGRIALGLEATDAHGMKALKREAVAPIVERCAMRGSLFDVEIVVRAGRAGLTVTELPAVVVERRAPRTSVVRRSLEGLAGLARLGLTLRLEDRRSSPGSLPDAPGAARAIATPKVPERRAAARSGASRRGR